MHIVGGGKMYIYPASDENPHPPGLEQNWQESFLVHFWDPHLSVGVYVRIGHEPNFNGGVLRLFSNVITPNGIFHRVEEVPLRAGDVSANGISADGGALNYAFDGTRIRWHVAEPGVTADLEIEDFHAAIDGYPKSGKLSEYVAQHVEVACRVTGTVTTQGKAYQVDGRFLRTGSANFTFSRSRRQDNDIIVLESTEVAGAFALKFEQIWTRRDNDPFRP